jgi:DNA-binding transcriptional ArsR family regulator
VASQHLSKLRFAGLVDGRRDGQRVVYRLRGGYVRSLLTEALFQADHQVTGTPHPRLTRPVSAHKFT